MEMFNILHAAINEEIAEIRESASNEMSASGKFLYDDGRLVIPVSESMQSMLVLPAVGEDRITVDSREMGRYQQGYIDATTLHNGVTRNSQLKRIDNISLSGLVDILEALIDGAKGDFYGVMIADGERRYNLLHPVVSAMLIAGTIKLSSKITAVLYRYEDKKEVDEELSNNYEDQIKDICAYIIRKKISPSLSLEPRTSLMEDIKSIVFNSDYEIQFRERNSNSEMIAIPVQLATNGGLTMPWYSLIYSNKNYGGGYSSVNLFPMSSGNVSSQFGNSSGGTCTGNHDSSMFSSLYVLNNMNISSMYFNACVPNDVASFVDACQRVSIFVLKAYVEGQK